MQHPRDYMFTRKSDCWTGSKESSRTLRERDFNPPVIFNGSNAVVEDMRIPRQREKKFNFGEDLFIGGWQEGLERELQKENNKSMDLH